jgi:hypothetical protein
MLQQSLTIFRCKAIINPCVGPGKVFTVSVSLNPAKLPELAELLPLDCLSCAPGDNSSTAPMLALGARGAGAGVEEDDYNSNIATPAYLTITNQT